MASPDLAERDKTKNMYFVYYLRSVKNNDLYIGSAEDVNKRLRQHNGGRVKSTKPYCPWQLLGYEECPTRGEAMKREKLLKSHQQREILKKKFYEQIGAVAKW